MSFQSWITKAIVTNNSKTISDFPEKLLDSVEYNLVEYLLGYEKVYGSIPTIETVKREFDSSELLLVDYVDPSSNIEQLFSEAKRSNFNRKSREIISYALSQEPERYVEILSSVEALESLVRPKSEPIGYVESNLYTIPSTKLDFKYKHLEESAASLLGGEVAMFVGPAKSKKTWVLLDLALDAYVRQNKRVYFTSLEMNSRLLQQRINALIGGFNPQVFRKGTPEELSFAQNMFNMRNKVIREKTTGEFIIPEKMTSTVWDVLTDIERYKPDVVFIDSIYLFKNEKGMPIQSDWGSLASMIAIIKREAVERDIQIIATSQIRRDASKSDLDANDVAFSQAFVQTCDLIVGMQPDDNNTLQERSLLKILASRNGGSGHIGYVTFDWENCAIQEHVTRAFMESVDLTSGKD